MRLIFNCDKKLWLICSPNEDCGRWAAWPTRNKMHRYEGNAKLAGNHLLTFTKLDDCVYITIGCSTKLKYGWQIYEKCPLQFVTMWCHWQGHTTLCLKKFGACTLCHITLTKIKHYEWNLAQLIVNRCLIICH